MIEKLDVHTSSDPLRGPIRDQILTDVDRLIIDKLNEIIDVVNRMNGEDYIDGPILARLGYSANKCPDCGQPFDGRNHFTCNGKPPLASSR